MEVPYVGQASACQILLKNASSILFFKLDSEGIIAEANRAAETVVGQPLTGRQFAELVVDFSGALDLVGVAAAPDTKLLLSLSTRTGLPQSFFFTFLSRGDAIFVLGELDSEEIQAMSRTVVALNQELSNMSRQLHQQNAQLRRLNDENQDLIQKLQRALSDVKTLSGLVPICSHCKSIRNDQGFWSGVESFLNLYPDSGLSHGICPVCADRYYPDMNLYDED